MFQKISALFISSLLFIAFQAKAEPVEGILGRWTAQEPLLGREVLFHLSFNFTENQTQMSVRCQYRDGSSLQVSAVAQTEYDGNTIFITEKNEGVVNDGFHFCRATLDYSRWQAYFDGTGKMVLFLPTPYQTRLTLVRDAE